MTKDLTVMQGRASRKVASETMVVVSIDDGS